MALRISDLLRLRVEDVLPEDGKIRSYLYVHEKKTGKTKRIKLNAVAKAALELFFERVPKTDPNAYLFTSRSGKPLDRTQVWRLINA
jgi:integrase